MTGSSLLARRGGPAIVFGTLVAIAYLAGVLIVRTPAFTLTPELAAALSFDLTLGVVAVAWVVLVRWAGLPLVILAPILLATLVLAGLVLPAERRGILDGVAAGAQLLELVVVAFGAVKLVRIVRRARTGAGAAVDGDLLVAAHRAVEDELGRRVAAVFATEIAVLAYGIGGWFRRPRVPDGAQAFGTLAAWRPMLAAIAILLVVETLGVHLLVSLVSPGAALVVTILSGYGLLWLVADGQAARHRPVLVTPETLVVRMGLRWTVTVPRDDVERVAKPDAHPGKGPERLVLAMDGRPNVEVWLRRPAVARGPFGIERRATRLAIGVDDADGLRAALRTGSP